MNKRPVAFRVPRLLGDMVSHYFVTTSEDEARAMADTNQVEYEGLYLVGDRHSGDAAQQPTERMWCLACGTVTRTGICDCNRYGQTECKPNFVNYADHLAAECERLTRSSAGTARPFMWIWRANVGGVWGTWRPLDQPVDDFRKGPWGFNLDNGTAEVKPLYADPPQGAREPSADKGIDNG
jgi:hypothetical protein